VAAQEDLPDAAEDAVRDACGRLVQGVMHLQHYWAYTAEAQVALYRGDAARAHAGMRQLGPALKRALLWRVVNCRLLVTALLGRSAVALSLARHGSERAALWREAEAQAARLSGEREAYAKPAASAILGSVAGARGDEAGAVLHFAAAARGYDAAHMKLYAAGARRLEGLFRSGDEGALQVREADAAFAAEGVLNPGRMTALLVGEWPLRRQSR
jgi:hypothetical protein